MAICLRQLNRMKSRHGADKERRLTSFQAPE
eukprot:CAMPEP_0119363850 /NCGR_PEP_ID=MMETSP1334-20130426/10764_1 /TAXON_ID=127549 /ORGANISM="Calcidiscus leptoporus, Strain RCC1130" /LENGTH=30 /DNA_ID= /DNA_START= /DNA_END= /DNA_ORIENTATION=